MAWTQADSVLLRRNVRAAFFGALDGPMDDYASMLATRIDTTDPTEDYAWLGNVPAVREFIGDRQVKDIVTESYSLSDKTWEATLGIDRHTIEDGKLGQIETRIRDLAVRARQHLNRRMTDVIEAGATTNGYDGVAYYAATHPSNAAGGGNRDNDLAETVTAAARMTAADCEQVIGAFVEHFSQLEDDQGEPMGMSSDGLVLMGNVVHWKGMQVALRNVSGGMTYNSGDFTSSGAYADFARYVANPYMSATNLVYAFKTNAGSMRPLIFQSRLPIELSDNLDGDQYFRSNKAEFGTRARYEVGYGPWEYSARMTVSI